MRYECSHVVCTILGLELQNLQEFLRLQGLARLFMTASSVNMTALDHLKRMGTVSGEVEKVADLPVHEAMWNLALICRERTSEAGTLAVADTWMVVAIGARSLYLGWMWFYWWKRQTVPRSWYPSWRQAWHTRGKSRRLHAHRARSGSP